MSKAMPPLRVRPQASKFHLKSLPVEKELLNLKEHLRPWCDKIDVINSGERARLERWRKACPETSRSWGFLGRANELIEVHCQRSRMGVSLLRTFAVTRVLAPTPEVRTGLAYRKPLRMPETQPPVKLDCLKQSA
jgi:hypothetical protein